MKKTIEDIMDVNFGEKVEVRGWVRNIRAQQNIAFLSLYDGSTFNPLQVVFDNKEIIEKLENVTSGCSVYVYGELVISPAKGQSHEVKAERFELISGVGDPEKYPMPMKRHSMEYLREKAHLRSRMNLPGVVMRLRSTMINSLQQKLIEKQFNLINTPLITSSDCEGAGDMFQVTTLDPLKENKDYSEDFFKKKVGLTVSGQLALEPFACSMGRVYTFGPTFRAENSHTKRHLAEFWMLEPEAAFTNKEEIIELSEDLLKHVVRKVMVKHSEEIEFLNKFVCKNLEYRLKSFSKNGYQKITYNKAIEILLGSKKTFELEPNWGIDLSSEHERYISEEVFNNIVVITDYPKDIKPFYMKTNKDNKTVACFDVIAPGVGEIIGGSQREDNYSILIDNMKKEGMDIEGYKWYTDLRKYGSVEHSGFGLGIERFLSFLTGVENVRDLIPYPRVQGSINY